LILGHCPNLTAKVFRLGEVGDFGTKNCQQSNE